MTLLLRLTSVRSFRATLSPSVGVGSAWMGGCPSCNKLRTAARYQNIVGFRTYANMAAQKKDPRLELYKVLSSRAQQLIKPEKAEGMRQRQKKQEILKKRKVSSHVRLEPVMSFHPTQQTHTQRGLSSRSNPNIYTFAEFEETQTSQTVDSVLDWQMSHRKPFRTTPRVTESVVDEEVDATEELEEEETPEKKAKRMRQMEKMKTLEKKQKEEQQYTVALMEACVSIGEMDRATRILFFLKNHKTQAKRKLLNIDVYNVVLRGWAKQANMDKIRHLFLLMTQGGIQPNIQSYSAALECMGRAEMTGDAPIRCVQQMQREGFNLEDIFTSCTFQADEQECILKAIRDGCGIDFTPPVPPPPQRCTTELVSSIYAEDNNNNHRGETSQSQPLFTEEEVEQRCKAQLEMETQHWLQVESIEGQQQPSPEVLKLRELLEAHKSMWKTGLLQAIRDLKKELNKQSIGKGTVNFYPFLCILEDQEYVNMMVQAVCQLAVTGDPLLITARDLGLKVQQKYRIKEKLSSGSVAKLNEMYQKYCSFMVNSQGGQPGQARELWYQLERAHGVCHAMGDTGTWPISLVINLGSLLVDVMVREVKIDNNLFRKTSEQKLIPALYHMYTYRNIKQVGIIKPHPMLVQLVEGAQDTNLTFDSSLLPMLMPPVPWSSVKKGGFLLSTTKLMRCSDATLQHQLLLEKVGTSELYPILDSLNQLGACAWKINQPILDLVIQVFNNKGSKELDIPQPVSEAPTMPKLDRLSNGDKQAIRKQMAQVRKLRSEMHSLRMDMLYKLSIANRFRDESFYFPHNMDFRGRVYPCPPHFNHLGSDVARSILVFAEGHPLGEKGLDWLKIHLVNLTGFKKKNSQAERLEFANEMMEEILDSADNPMTGRKWWMTTDEPWQALACCMEIANAVRSPDPQAYVSHFPVHQDGSCNGLQHYAALGRDVTGAHQVNLMPADSPQDVYSGVALQVEKLRLKDAEEGVKIAQVLDGFIRRKVVKQTVMTVVYGVTRYGGRLQIQRQLKDIPDFPQEHVWEAAGYLVAKVFMSLREIFTLAREIQDWLTESARLISHVGSAVQWVTPLGLPVVQPYHKKKSKVVRNDMQNFILSMSTDASERPDIMKQKNAFPPNFIHSLDSTHMMLTSLHCQLAGIQYVSVHDCFWTHACTVDTMNRVCREQFVALHSQPILEDLSKYLVQEYGTLPAGLESSPGMDVKHDRLMEVLVSVPPKGDFDLKRVLDSTYFFS